MTGLGLIYANFRKGKFALMPRYGDANFLGLDRCKAMLLDATLGSRPLEKRMPTTPLFVLQPISLHAALPFFNNGDKRNALLPFEVHFPPRFCDGWM